MKFRQIPVLVSILCGSLLSAAVADISGVWKLNLQKSKFDKDAAPLSVQLTIQHREPSLKYSGTVQRSQESSPDTFAFDGAVDKKIYPVTENQKTGRTIKFARKSDRVLESWSSDDTMEEYAVTEVSADGKTLTRQMRVKLKNGKSRAWTEVYDRQS